MSGNGSNKFSNFEKDRETQDVVKTMNLPDGSNISQTSSPPVSVSAQMQHHEQQNSPGVPNETDTTGHSSGGVSEKKLCHVRADGQAVRAEFGMSTSPTSPTAPCQDLQTKNTPADQPFSNQYNMCARQVLPIGEGNFKSNSPQSGSQDNDRPRVHRESLTKTESADGNDKHPDAMDISMKGSIVDDKWYCPSNCANNMNFVHMEDKRDYKAEGAKLKTEPDHSIQSPWKEIYIAICHTSDQRVIEEEKVTADLNPLKMQYLLHYHKKDLLQKFKTGFEFLNICSLEVEDQKLLINISFSVGKRIIPQIVDLLQEIVEDFVKCKFFPAKSMRYVQNELEPYLSQGSLAIYCDSSKLYLVGNSQTVCGLESTLAEIKQSSQVEKSSSEITFETSFEVFILCSLGLQDHLVEKFPSITFDISEERRSLLLYDVLDHVRFVNEEIKCFRKSIVFKEISTTPLEAKLLELGDVKDYIKRSLDQQKLRVVFKTSVTNCKLSIYCRGGDDINEICDIIKSEIFFDRFPVVDKDSRMPTFAKCQHFQDFVNAYENKFLIVDWGNRNICIATTKPYGEKLIEMKKDFEKNAGSIPSQKTDDGDLNESISKMFPGSSVKKRELQTLNLTEEQFFILQNLNFADHLNRNVPACNADLEDNAIVFSGSRDSIEDEIKTFFMQYVDSETVGKKIENDIPDKCLTFFCKDSVKSYINEKLANKKIFCYWLVDENKSCLRIYTGKGMIQTAKDVILSCVSWEEFAKTSDFEKFLENADMKSLFEKHKSRLSLDLHGEELLIVGLDQIMKEFWEIYRKHTDMTDEKRQQNSSTFSIHRLEISKNILQYLKKFKGKELQEFEQSNKVHIQADEHGVIFLKGESASIVEKAVKVFRKSRFYEKKWSCQLDNPEDIQKQLSSRNLQNLENKFKCSVFLDPVTSYINNQQLAHWTSHTKDLHLVFFHGSIANMAADIIVYPTRKFKAGENMETSKPTKQITISSLTRNLPCLMVAYLEIPVYKPGIPYQSGMVKMISELFAEVEQTKLQSIVIPAKIAEDICEQTFLHWFIDAFKAFQHKFDSLNQIYICTDLDTNLPQQLSVLKDGLHGSLALFDFENMFEPPLTRYDVNQKPADITVTLVKGKLVDQKVDVIVNSCNHKLELFKGAVSASILNAAGESIANECKQKYPTGIISGQVITTSPGKLSCKQICHGALPVWNPTAKFSSKILMKLVFDCLLSAELVQCNSIAFPVLGTGNLAYPWDEVAHTMIDTIYKYGRKYPHTALKDVKIVLYEKDEESIEAFETEKKKKDEVEMTKEDHIPPPASILECRCRNVRVKLEPLSEYEFSHCQTVAMIYPISQALAVQKEDPQCDLVKNGFSVDPSEENNFWVVSVFADEKNVTSLTDAFNKVLSFSEDKRLSTLALCLMEGKDCLPFIDQATVIRDFLNKKEIYYLQTLKLTITNRTTYDTMIIETIHKQEKERKKMTSKFSEWFYNVSKLQWKCVNYSDTIQSPRLMVTVVGEDEKSVTVLKENVAKEIAVLKTKRGQYHGATIKNATSELIRSGKMWIRTTKMTKLELSSDACKQLDDAIRDGLQSIEISEDGTVYLFDLRTKQYRMHDSNENLGIFFIQGNSPDPQMTGQQPSFSQAENQNEETIFKECTYEINPALQQNQLKKRLFKMLENLKIGFNHTNLEITGSFEQMTSLNQQLIKEFGVETGLFLKAEPALQTKRSNNLQKTTHKPKQEEEFQLVVEIKIPYIEYRMLKFFCPECQLFKGSPAYSNGSLRKLLQADETEDDLKKFVESKSIEFQSLTNFDVPMREGWTIPDAKLKEIEAELKIISPETFCYRSKDLKALTLKGYQYEKLQMAKTKCEFILGIKQQGRGGRRDRVISTDPTYKKEENEQMGNKSFSKSVTPSRSSFSQSFSGGSSSPSSPPPSTITFKTSEGLLIHVYGGNILNLKVDCIVNAANETLSHGGGVADVISRAAGYGFQQESDDYIQRNGQLNVTECCTTSAGNLPYQCVIHAVGPRWFSYTDKRKCAYDLEETVKNCFQEAEKKMMTSVAIPAISSGIFGVPREVCSAQYCNAVKNYSNSCGKTTCLREIHFMDKDTYMVGLIQKEFKQNLNIDQPAQITGSRVSNPSGHSLSKNENTPTYARSLSDDTAKAEKYSGNTNDRNDNPNDSVKQEKFQKQYMTSKGFKVHVVQDNITKMSVDVIICPQDDFCLSKGRIAKAIANASNERYRNDVVGMKTVKRCEVKKIAASPSTLPFKYVLHTVAPRWDKEAVKDNAKFMKELRLTIRNILKHCSDSKNISTAAIPVLGIGVDGNETPYATYASILSEEISKEMQNDQFSMEELYIVTSEWGMASAVTDQLDKEKLFTPCTSFQRRKRHNKDKTDGTDEDRDGKRNRNSTTGAKPKSGTAKLGTTVKGGNLEDCVICMDTPDDPRRLNCGHIYCYNCISQHFKINNPVCPTCGSIQGIVTGNQPPGTMKVSRRYSSLAGYPDCGRIEIEYNIDSGRQGPEHKEEGRRFEGIRRIGYLPDNKKGQFVAKMLRVAFDRKLVFTIGDSRTTGKQGVVTWNDIHHKTNPKPYEQFGYPDDTYLDRVIDELSAKGVTEKDIGPNTAIY